MKPTKTRTSRPPLRAASKTPKRPAAAKGPIELSLPEHGLEPILGAAYLMMDRAYVLLGGDGKKRVTLTLKSKNPVVETAALYEDFLVELETQKVRWALAKNNQPIREYVAEQAILLANGQLPPQEQPAAEPAADQLTAEQRSEIEKLIAEVEDEIKAVKDKKVQPDPKNIKSSWEEKQETRRSPQP